MCQGAYIELTELIKQITIGIKTQVKDYQFMDDVLKDLKIRTLSVNPSSAMPLIKELQDSLSKTEYRDIWPFLYLFIAYAYCSLNERHAARISAEDAVRKFINDDGNLALAQWFLAIIYREDGYIKDAKEQLVNAQITLSRIITQTPDDEIGWKLKDNCSLLIDQIKQVIANMPAGETRLFDSARRDQKARIPSGNEEQILASKAPFQRQRTPAGDGDDLGISNKRNPPDTSADQGTTGGNGNNGGDKTTTGGDSSVGKNNSSPISLHINIPIDIHSADHIDQNSIGYLLTHQDREEFNALQASTKRQVSRSLPAQSTSFSHPSDLGNDSYRALLRNYHERLVAKYENLRQHKQRIPSTLVASIFYIYRILTPAHSVYGKIPEPATEREKEVYEELRSKVGFFEIIEQLVALEREFAPTATREELLNTINHEWDRAVKR